jgi:hypothetical protein
MDENLINSLKIFFYENIHLIDKNKDILDDVTDEKIGEEKYKEFNIDFDDGGRAYGKIQNGIAYIAGIQSPKIDILTPRRGTKTYQRVLKLLSKNGINTIKIDIQSKDSRIAIDHLLKKNVLINPREMTGLSIDQYPRKFDINYDKLMLEYRHNLADGTPAPSLQAHNGKNPNILDKKNLHTIGPY